MTTVNKLKKTSNKRNTNQAAHIETFLFCPKLGNPKKQNDPDHFFSNLTDLDERLGECVVFFSLPSALQYSRFMNTDHAVLRAYVKHTAIEGHGHGLKLKKGHVTKHHIHGCFPGWAKGSVYMENPVFTVEQPQTTE